MTLVIWGLFSCSERKLGWTGLCRVNQVHKSLGFRATQWCSPPPPGSHTVFGSSVKDKLLSLVSQEGLASHFILLMQLLLACDFSLGNQRPSLTCHPTNVTPAGLWFLGIQRLV